MVDDIRYRASQEVWCYTPDPKEQWRNPMSATAEEVRKPASKEMVTMPQADLQLLLDKIDNLLVKITQLTAMNKLLVESRHG